MSATSFSSSTSTPGPRIPFADHAERVVGDVDRAVGTAPLVRLQLRLSPVVEHLRHGGAPTTGLTVRALALAARLAFETRDDPTSVALYDAAEQAAERISDQRRLAAVRTSRAMVALHSTGDVALARRHARTATVAAHRSAVPTVQARAHAVLAEVTARSGRPPDAHRELARARAAIEQASTDDPLRSFDTARLDGFEGVCALHAGRAQDAHDRLDGSRAALTAGRDAVQLGIVTADLALSHLRLGDAEACTDLLHRAVDLAAATGGRVPERRVAHVRRRLDPWRDEPFVHDIDDHIHERLLGR